MNRKVELFTAGCGLCDDLVTLVRSVACPSCDVTVHDMTDLEVAERAKAIGVTAVPAVVVNGALVARSEDGGYSEAALRASGIGSTGQR